MFVDVLISNYEGFIYFVRIWCFIIVRELRLLLSSQHLFYVSEACHAVMHDGWFLQYVIKDTEFLHVACRFSFKLTFSKSL